LIFFSSFQALKKRQEEVEAIRRRQEEERRKREEYDREGRQQVSFRHKNVDIRRAAVFIASIH
jgi:hypothetical protein